MEINDMPVRYIQTIYKQYTIFLKDKQAQENAAAEDVLEELEDGAMMGGGSRPQASINTNEETKDEKSMKQMQLEAWMKKLSEDRMKDEEEQEE